MKSGGTRLYCKKNKKNMKKFILPLLLVLAVFGACKKKDSINCKNAELRIKNIGTDTIYYAFNSSAFTEILMPDSTVSQFVGHIEVSDEVENTVTTTFQSDHGNYFITIDECVEKRTIK